MSHGGDQSGRGPESGGTIPAQSGGTSGGHPASPGTSQPPAAEGVAAPGEGAPQDPQAAAAQAGGDAMIGQVIDNRYQIIQKLGEGGMGEVYAAEHVHIEKRVAIKLLRSEIVTNEQAVIRFRREAKETMK